MTAPTVTISNSSAKILRINEDEKVLLHQLRKLYSTDYKHYCKHIKTESSVPLSVKKVYVRIDERQAYRRIADFFHRERLATLGKRRNSNSLKKILHSSTSCLTQVQAPMGNMKLSIASDELNDNYLEQTSSTMMKDHIDGVLDNQLIIDYDDDDDDEDLQEINISESYSLNQQQQILAQNDNGYDESQNPRASASSTDFKSDLISIRKNVQTVLYELDRVVQNSDSTNEEQRCSKPNISINGHSQRKLDDIVRSLSNVVNQHHENVCSIFRETSSFLIHENTRLENVSTIKDESIKHTIERLNSLIDRGNNILDRAEKILSEF